MPPHTVLGLLLVCLLMSGCTSQPGMSPTPPPGFSLAAEGEGNTLTVSATGPAAVLDVHSRSGIGSATVVLESGRLPKTLVLRLHLRGLEEFRLSYDQTVITAAVASAEGHAIREGVVLAGGDERSITAESPLWMDIRIVSAQANPRIPLEEGHFAITLPADLLRAERRSFTIRWIDFYR